VVSNACGRLGSARTQQAVPDREALDNEIAQLRGLDLERLRARWHTVFRRRALPHLPRHLLFRILAYQLQADRLGDLDAHSWRLLDRLGSGCHFRKLYPFDSPVAANQNMIPG
jgi:hypothetical protein